MEMEMEDDGMVILEGLIKIAPVLPAYPLTT